MLMTAVSRSILGALLVLPLLAAAPASANGPCGQDFDGDHACGLTSPATVSGSLVTDNEKDYYVFYARKGTELQVTITDTELATCTENLVCGYTHAELLEGNGDEVYDGASSEPNNGITVPGDFDRTIETSGTYYLLVSGELGRDNNGNPAPVPYTLGVSASPTVQWPAPQPAHKVSRCTVHRVRHHGHLVRVRKCRTVRVGG